MYGPKTEKDYRESYEGAMMYLAVVLGEVCRNNPGLMIRADQRMLDIERGGLNPFMSEMGRHGAYWLRQEIVRNVHPSDDK